MKHKGDVACCLSSLLRQPHIVPGAPQRHKTGALLVMVKTLVIMIMMTMMMTILTTMMFLVLHRGIGQVLLDLALRLKL